MWRESADVSEETEVEIQSLQFSDLKLHPINDYKHYHVILNANLFILFISVFVFECFRILDCFVNFGTESILLVLLFFFLLFISVAFSFHRFLFSEIFVLFFFQEWRS